MRRSKAIWKSMFDVREGELALTLPMSLYLLFVMFAYYVLKPVSRALFLTEFKVDKLPYLNMLIAGAGGLLAYFYSKFIVRVSLQAAVGWTMSIAAFCLTAFWWLTGPKLPWMLYVFNIWVSLFSAILVSQGWLVAANLDPGVPAAAHSGRIRVAMVEIKPICVEIEREEDGRILASVPDLPGVMAYGGTEDEAVRKVKSIALQVLADMIESGEDVPEPLKVLFAA